MKTAKEVRDAKSRIISQGRSMEEWKASESFKLVHDQLDKEFIAATESLKSAESWEDYKYKLGVYHGLVKFDHVVETIIARGKSQERLTSK